MRVPGDPARLEARPSRKLLRTRRELLLPGGRPRRRRVHDAHRHDLGGRRSRGGDAGPLRVDASGKVTVATDAPEGAFDAIVSAAGKSTRVTVEVASSGAIRRLLQQSGLNDAGENDTASVAMIAASQIGGGDARAEDGSRRRRGRSSSASWGRWRSVWGSLAVAATGGRGARRRSSARPRSAMRSSVEAAEARRSREAGAARRRDACPRGERRSRRSGRRPRARSPRPCDDMPCLSARVRPRGVPSAPGRHPIVPLNASRAVEPRIRAAASVLPCKRGYDPGIKVCPHDKEELIPYALYASRQPACIDPAAAARGKICPSCGRPLRGRRRVLREGRHGAGLAELTVWWFDHRVSHPRRILREVYPLDPTGGLAGASLTLARVRLAFSGRRVPPTAILLLIRLLFRTCLMLTSTP